MERTARFSSLVFALVLSPAILQLDCGPRTGDTTLSSLEFETSGLNQVLGFKSSNRAYHVWIPGGVDTAIIRAQSTDSGSAVSWNWNGVGGPIGTGGGMITLDIPVGSSTLGVYVTAPGGASESYIIEVNPTCNILVDCDDGNECTDDPACDLFTSLCPQSTPVAAGAVCDLFATGDGVCVDSGACAIADSQEWGVPQMIETEFDDASLLNVGVDGSGNAIAVWRQGFGHHQLWANRFTTTAGWGEAELLETQPDTLVVGSPDLVVDAAGNAIAIWEQEESDNGRIDIWVNHYTPGSGWGGAELLETDDTGDARNPSIAMRPSGDVAVASWSQSEGPPPLSHLPEVFSLLASHLQPDGSWSAPTALDSTVPSAYGNASAAKIVLDANGGAIAVWSQNGAWARYYTPGSGWNSSAALIWFPPPGEAAGFAGLTGDAAGNATMILVGQPAANQLSAMRYTAGTGWGTEELISSDADASWSVVGSDSGDALVVGRSYPNIWANRYSQGAWQGIENVYPGPGNPPITTDPFLVGHTAAAMDEAGNAFVVWRALRPDLEPVIYRSRYVAGVGWEDPEPFEDAAPVTAIATFPKVAIGANGSAMAVWLEGDALGLDDVWAVPFQP